jgi:hypothetical protein
VTREVVGVFIAFSCASTCTTIILPFVKTVYISGNFIAIEKFSIVEWDDVKDAVAEQTFVDNGGTIITVDENKVKKQPITVYGESTPNPSALKFVVSRMLTKTAIEFKNIDQTEASPSERVIQLSLC